MPAVRYARPWNRKPPQAWQQIHPYWRQGIMCCYLLNDGAGTTTYNAIGGNNGTFAASTAAPTWSSGYNGPSVKFATGSSQYIDCGQFPQLNGATQASIFVAG